MKSIAILHDRIPAIGGAENVVVDIAKILESPLFTSYKDTDHYDDSAVEIIPFKQNKYTKSIYKPLLRQEIVETMSLAFDFAELDLSKYGDYDFIFSSGMFSKGYIPTIDQYNINYTYTPIRWVYDLHKIRMDGINNPIQKFIYDEIAQWWRTWDITTNKFVDQFISTSDIVQQRIKRYWNRDSKVIYPPIYTKQFKKCNDEGYYLSINRLYPEKRIDLIIDAFKKTGNKIKIIGKGMDKIYKKQAKGFTNIEFLGNVSDFEKKELLSHCRAVVYIPIHEDFGIVPIEAFASGKPVIGINEGFTKYQINDSNGVVIKSPEINHLIEAIKKIEETEWNKDQIQKAAEKYDIEVFKRNIIKIVNEDNNDDDEDDDKRI